jgi:hypothetical protein
MQEAPHGAVARADAALAQLVDERLQRHTLLSNPGEQPSTFCRER